MRVVSFNIQHGRSAEGAVDVGLLARTCASFEADVLALQEVDVSSPRSGLVHEAKAVARACGMAFVFGQAARIGGVGRYGNAVLVRGSIVDSTTVRLTRDNRRHEPRGAVVVGVELSDQAGPAYLSVVATHLSIHRPEVFAQLAEVVELAAPAAGNGEPIVLLGDLNLTTDEVRSTIEASGLTLAGDDTPTFPARQPVARIDHIALGGPLEFAGLQVRATPSSDHLPLFAEVAVVAG